MDVEILAFDGVENLDVFAPLSALASAGFEVALVAEGGPRQVRTAHGTGLTARQPGTAPGVLVVPGGGWIIRSERAGTDTLTEKGGRYVHSSPFRAR